MAKGPRSWAKWTTRVKNALEKSCFSLPTLTSTSEAYARRWRKIEREREREKRKSKIATAHKKPSSLELTEISILQTMLVFVWECIWVCSFHLLIFGIFTVFAFFLSWLCPSRLYFGILLHFSTYMCRKKLDSLRPRSTFHSILSLLLVSPSLLFPLTHSLSCYQFWLVSVFHFASAYLPNASMFFFIHK